MPKVGILKADGLGFPAGSLQEAITYHVAVLTNLDAKAVCVLELEKEAGPPAGECQEAGPDG